jgi:hypothetical protein
MASLSLSENLPRGSMPVLSISSLQLPPLPIIFIAIKVIKAAKIVGFLNGLRYS